MYMYYMYLNTSYERHACLAVKICSYLFDPGSCALGTFWNSGVAKRESKIKTKSSLLFGINGRYLYKEFYFNLILLQLKKIENIRIYKFYLFIA